MSEPNQEPKYLKDVCYPIGSTQPSYIRVPEVTIGNFKIKPQIINMLPKFTEIKDAYLFTRSVDVDVLFLFADAHLVLDHYGFRSSLHGGEVVEDAHG